MSDMNKARYYLSQRAVRAGVARTPGGLLLAA